jgi:hypothetical protein
MDLRRPTDDDEKPFIGLFNLFFNGVVSEKLTSQNRI